MSRCFPFPPPGYENKPIAESIDLLTKEKRKEKHKKDKKDKEKRGEHKEKKEKDRSKEKQKEKKDRKEKHKDRKKDKDIDKGKSSEDRRAEDRNEGTHNRESLQKAEQVKDSKLAEELGERIRDDGADNRLVTTSIHRKIEHRTVAHPSLEKDIRVADKKVFPVPIGSSQRNDGNNLPVENSKNSPHRRIGNISAATSIDLERSKLSAVGIKTDQNRNHGMSRSIEAIPGLVNRRVEYPTAGMEKERFPEKNVVSNSIAPSIDNKGKLGTKVVASNSARKKDFLAFPAESLSSIRSKTDSLGNSFIQSRLDGTGTVPAIEKERVKGSGMFSLPVSSDQRRNNTLSQPVQKDRNQKVDKKDEVGKGLNHKEHGTKKIIKPKDTDKHTKEEEEKIVEKASVIENNKIRNFGKKDQIDTLNSKPLAPHRNNSLSIIKGVDETSNKRTNLKINGFILENDARPNKMPRLLASSSQPLAAGLPSIPDRMLDHKDREINGSAKSPDGRNGEVSLKLKSPHPDSKYLEQIHTVPKMEPWLENGGDLEWLFNRCDSSPKKPASDKESLSQVWSDALWIESADVLALPYVVPF